MVVQAQYNGPGAASGRGATATVRVVPDQTFDCTDAFLMAFDDVNRNGFQDSGEKGAFPGVRELHRTRQSMDDGSVRSPIHHLRAHAERNPRQ